MQRFSDALFNVVICTDDQCNVDCRTWTAAFGECTSSAIIDDGKITLYSDSNCSTIIPGSDNIPILLGASCNVLLSNLYSRHIGSYKVSQAGFTGPIIAVVVLVILCCFCACWLRPTGGSEPAVPLLYESEDPE